MRGGMRPWGARVALCAVLALGSTVAASAHAQGGDVAAAANAFTQAQRAELTGDHARAAELYELADSIAPTPEALRSALRARRAAGQNAIAATRAEQLLERYPADADSKTLAKGTLDELGPKLARYEVTCRPKACSVVVDGKSASADAREKHILYLEPGEHTIGAAFGDLATKPTSVTGEAGARSELSFEEPERPAPDPAPTAPAPAPAQAPPPGAGGAAEPTADSSGGLSPWWFVAGAAVTVGLGATATWSGLDTLSENDEYNKNRTQDGYEHGQSLERRTNVLFAVTGVAAVGTVVLAVLTDWGGSGEPGAEGGAAPQPSLGVSAGPGGAAVTLGGAF